MIISAHFTKHPRLSGAASSGHVTQDGFWLILQGEWGTPYSIQQSENLVDWTPWITLTNLFGTTRFTDESCTNQPQRFYRALNQPW